MKVPFWAAVFLTAVLCCSAAIAPECRSRKAKGLPLHWAKPDDCSSFYKCTNKNVVRVINCPDGKEYGPKVGKCVAQGRGACKLSLLAPMDDRDNNLCTNKSSGAYVANDYECRNFFLCDKNLAYPQECPAGSFFNTTKEACVPDPLRECWQNYCLDKANGTFLADSRSCMTFYVCSQNATAKQTCDPDSSFNATTLTCQPDSNHYCWENLCVGKQDNTLIPNEESCGSYYTCQSEIPEIKMCNNGSYFDRDMLLCKEGECPYKNETSTPCPQTTTACPATTTECPSHTTTTECPTTETTQCPTTESTTQCASQRDCQCNGVTYASGSFAPHETNCNLFYICEDGHLVESSCAPGNFYNRTSKVCERDTNNVCPACHQKTGRGKRSVEDPLVEEEPKEMQETNVTSDDSFNLDFKNLFQKFLKEEIKAHATKEQEEKEAEEKRQQEAEEERVRQEEEAARQKEEDEKKAFEMETLAIKKRNSPAITCLGKYLEGQFVVDKADCHKYYVCYYGELVEQDCGSGNYYDAKTQKCVKDVNNLCPSTDSKPSERKTLAASSEYNMPLIPKDRSFRSAMSARSADLSCTCPGGYTEGQLVKDHTSCHKYYICHNSEMVSASCGHGNLFNCTTRTCERDDKRVCWKETESCNSPSTTPDVCADHPNYYTYPAPHQCYAFNVCINGVTETRNCSGDYYYNAAVERCEPDVNAVCHNPCENVCKGIQFVPNPDCTKYFLCNNGKPFVYSCNTGYFFNPVTSACEDSSVCWTDVCLNKTDGFMIPINDQYYYQCQDNLPQVESCPAGTRFDATLLQCVKAPSPDCNQAMCPTNAPFPTISQCASSFCYCKDGSAYKDKCPQGYQYNNTVQRCVTNEPCDPVGCNDEQDFYHFTNTHDPNSLCLCLHNTPVSVKCPCGTTYSPSAQLCVPIVVPDPQCVVGSCDGQVENLNVPALEGENGICICKSEVPKYIPCAANQIVNADLSICVSTAQSCAEEMCADGKVKLFSSVDPAKFCYCPDTHTVVERDCPQGQTFNAKLGICAFDDCPSINCNKQPEGFTFPTNKTLYGFCYCKNNEATLETCPPNNIYNDELGVCQSESYLLCDSALCANLTCYPSPVPAINDTSSFCMCSSPTVVNKIPCPDNYVYNSVTQRCTPNYSDITNGCTCPGGYNEGDFLPDKHDCAKFYICHNGVMTATSCGQGNYFDPVHSVCAKDVKNFCCPTAKCSCLDTYYNGQYISHPTNSHLYYLCSDGKFELQNCGHNSSFDPINNICSYDSTDLNRKFKRSVTEVAQKQPEEEVRSFKILTKFFKKMTGTL